MILLFGTTAKLEQMLLVSFICNFCGVHASQQVYRRVNRFTLFFVPLFRVSTRYFVECSNCGGVTSLTREQAEHAQQWAASRA